MGKIHYILLFLLFMLNVIGTPSCLADNAWNWFVKGMDLATEGRHEEAIQAYQEALKIDPTYTWVWVYMGMSYAELGRDEEQLQAYDKALEIDPGFIFAWVYKALGLDDLGRNDEAIVAYKRAIELLQYTNEPGYERYKSEMPFSLGYLYFRMGKYEDAIEFFEKAISAAPSGINLDHIRVFIDIAKKRLEAAKTSHRLKDESFMVTTLSARNEFLDKTIVSGNISNFQKSFSYQSGLI